MLSFDDLKSGRVFIIFLNMQQTKANVVQVMSWFISLSFLSGLGLCSTPVSRFFVHVGVFLQPLMCNS